MKKAAGIYCDYCSHEIHFDDLVKTREDGKMVHVECYAQQHGEKLYTKEEVRLLLEEQAKIVKDAIIEELKEYGFVDAMYTVMTTDHTWAIDMEEK